MSEHEKYPPLALDYFEKSGVGVFCRSLEEPFDVVVGQGALSDEKMSKYLRVAEALSHDGRDHVMFTAIPGLTLR